MAENIPRPKERNLYLAQQVTQDSINKITSSIIEIAENDLYLKKIYSIDGLEYKPKPIMLYIDSYGGHVYQCMGLLGVMKSSTTPVNTVVTGCAMSCGFLISISGSHRMGYKNSTYLYHQVISGISGKAKDIEEEWFEVKRLQKIIEKITLENTSITKKKLKEVYKAKLDWFIDSTQALKMGIIDEVI